MVVVTAYGYQQYQSDSQCVVILETLNLKSPVPVIVFMYIQQHFKRYTSVLKTAFKATDQDSTMFSFIWCRPYIAVTVFFLNIVIELDHL